MTSAATESLEVALVVGGGLASGGERGYIVFVEVQALATGDQLESAEQQIEAVRELRAVAVRVGVERALRGRSHRRARKSRPWPSTANTLAPLSVADATIFGVWISVESQRVECRAKSRDRRRRELEDRVLTRVA